MNKKLTISLSVLIILLLCIIAAGVYGLYHGVPVSTPQFCQSEPEQDSVAPNQAEMIEKHVADSETQISQASIPEPESEPKALAPKVTSVKVKNCGTGKQNTLRQNADNSIELINEKGKSLWKKQLPCQWGGTAGQVDYFSNKKIQFLIAAGKQIYLIDRLGRDVQGFPKPIPFEAVNGPVPVKTSKGASAWKIETTGEAIYLSAKANEILTQLP